MAETEHSLKENLESVNSGDRLQSYAAVALDAGGLKTIAEAEDRPEVATTVEVDGLQAVAGVEAVLEEAEGCQALPRPRKGVQAVGLDTGGIQDTAQAGSSSGGRSHPSAKELKKSPPHGRPSPSRLNKNVSTTTEKISCQAAVSQATIHYRGKNQSSDAHQQNRVSSTSTASCRASRLKKEPVIRKRYEAELSKIPSAFKDTSWHDSSREEDVLIQSFYCREKGKFESNSEGHSDEAGPCSPLYPGASADALFLDFESVRIMKEDSDEGSASDLSDSERIPIPPSPCTPPELNLRAEEIDPLSFERHFDTKSKQSDYYYPDFLPPPFNTWDLKGLAVFVNTECKSEPRPQPVEPLEKYIDRLLELEWLQAQTIQAEKGKMAKARPQTAPSALRTLKSPGKRKSLHSPLPNKQLVPHESAPRFPSSHSGRRRDGHGEGMNRVVPGQSHLKAAEATFGSSAHQRQPSEVKSEAKKRPPIKQPLLNVRSCESSCKIQGAGNMRPPKQSSSFHGAAVSLKGLPASTCTNPKKNGSTNNYVPSKKVLTEKKLKASVKQTPCKFK
ncbi:protein FAM217B [Tiliqua scincoides]|uniref:protein FAM217B n=1 Tax=Tiliqua scincoides TaxID=71010 RepID=UPI0034624236